MFTIQISGIDPDDQELVESIRIEIASLVYKQGFWSIGQAARFAGLAMIEFQDQLALRGITLNYDEAELDKDLAAIKKFLDE